ncbi:MAG: GNAT family N-acetyltransferase [Bacteroidota bacterium]
MNRSNISLLEQELDLWESYDDPQRREKAPVVLSAAEKLLAGKGCTPENRDLFFRYLDITRLNSFLTALSSREERYRWTETTFSIIGSCSYNLNDLFRHRVMRHGERTLFTVNEGERTLDYSYSWCYKRMQQLAAVFYSLSPSPRVVILAGNSLDSALCDLACLSFDILVSPVNIHFSQEQLSGVFLKLDANIVVTDSEERVSLLENIRTKFGLSFHILLTGYSGQPVPESFMLLGRQISQLSTSDTDSILARRKPKNIKSIATVMFTSGSTGDAKGVAFSIYNLITKRFARAAALPFVGENELMLCYLPLFHTFGRYLEMMGSLFWGGTYVFASNPSVETLIAQMNRFNPTALISIPLRWSQIRDYYLDEEKKLQHHHGSQESTFKRLISSRLYWGLSAAGYLDPRVFTFFHRHNVMLCSGFGMTEATGGISMTPPEKYVKNSVGIPLPGIEIRLNKTGELEIRGHYVASYLEDDEMFDPDQLVDASRWLSTGDLFRLNEDGYLFIVDRIKDIYKNNKGQTIAPGRVEKIFDNIPGFKRTFLAGDARPYNTLLIVPDTSDPLFRKTDSQNRIRNYFAEVIASANKELAPYERIVDFVILDRDFEETRGELTSKGTYRRKNITENFAETIERLYKYPNVEFMLGDIRIHIPRWVYRDLGLTANDIVLTPRGLSIKNSERKLTIRKSAKTGRIRVGDLEYMITSGTIDLGIFVHQPALWLGNPALISFANCKEGWDVRHESVSAQVFLPSPFRSLPDVHTEDSIPGARLRQLNTLICLTLFSRRDEACNALGELETVLHSENHRTASVIRHRIEALALHPDFRVRSRAYRILLFEEPRLDYSNYLPAFIASGLPFLSKKDIEDFAGLDIGQTRMYAFRLRLQAYRDTMSWPARDVTVSQFRRIFDLLVQFVRHNRRFYSTVRSELINWVLLKQEPRLSGYAEQLFDSVGLWFESTFRLSEFEKNPANWASRMVFQDEIPAPEIKRIRKTLCSTSFLKESLMLIYDEEKFGLQDVLPDDGIWISKVLSSHGSYLYRVSINMVNGKHFDIMLLIRDNITDIKAKETIYWIIRISGIPGGQAVLPGFGNYRKSLGAASMAFINDLTVWSKIREYSSYNSPGGLNRNIMKWKSLYVRAMAAYIKLWYYSGKTITPGSVSPANAVVPKADFRGNSYILSLSGWKYFESHKSLIQPLIQNFYGQIYANFPWNRDLLRIEWMFDAVYEALDNEQAEEFISGIKTALKELGYKQISAKLEQYCSHLTKEPYVNLQILSAMERYRRWQKTNPGPTPEAKEQFIRQLNSLYRIDDQSEIMRYIFYSGTYFSGAAPEIKNRLRQLTDTMFRQPGVPGTKFIELSELQESLITPTDRRIFSSMVFPEFKRPLQIELVPFGDEGHRDILIKTHLQDNSANRYIVRKAVSPFEIGSLYRLFILDDYPVSLTSDDQFLILTDEETQETVYGGVCYRINEGKTVMLEGLVVAAPFRGKSLGAGLLEDFCGRMIAQDVRIVTTHFYMTAFFKKHKFRTDSRWGGLVRFLDEQ